jgi:hypothetical protein
MRRLWLLLDSMVILVVACCTGSTNRPPPKSAASPGHTLHERKKITTGGGVLSSDGAQLVVPAGALKNEATFSITRVEGAELAGFPQGTALGFTFEPAGQQFRIPVLVEIPNDALRSEAMCQNVSGERIPLPAEAAEDLHYHFYVTELPERCAIFAPEHSAALEAARGRHAAVVAKENERHKWAIQSELCNPNLFFRPNAARGLVEPPGVGGCPPGMTPIRGKLACVDRWEAHVVEVLDDGTFHSWSPYFNPGAMKIRARSAPGAVPQGYISQVQASAACAEAGKRLCSDVEWVTACRGSKKTQFPYGKTEKSGACNDRRARHPAIEYLQSNDVFAKLEHPCINQVPDTVMLTGAKSECATPEGVFDMVGNLHEWTADRNGTFRGGYYVEAKLNGHGCDYVTTRHDAIYWDYSVGFRCCADLNPARDGSGVRVSPE